MKDTRQTIMRFSILLLTLLAIVYAPALFNEFNIDDFILLDNADAHLFKTFTDFFTKAPDQHYTPLNYLFTNGLFALFPPRPFLFHLTNLLLFFALGLLFFQLIRNVSGNVRLAGITTVLFVIHPMSAVIVDRITFNTALLLWADLMLCALLALLAFTATEKKRLLCLSLVCFTAALFTQELAVLFPGYAAILLFFGKKISPVKILKLLLPFLGLTVIFLGMWWGVSGKDSNPVLQRHLLPLSLSSYLSSLAALAFWYVRNLFWPADIVFIFTIPLVTQNHVLYLAGLLSAVFAAAGSFWAWKKDLLRIGILWFLLGFTVLPFAMLGHPEIGVVIQPHWFFFSSLGFFLILGWGLLELEKKIARAAFHLGLAILSVFFLTYTQYYHQIARTEKSLCLHWLKTTPNNPIPLQSLGKIYLSEGKNEQAVSIYRQILATSRYRPDIINNQLALAALEQGNLAQAHSFAQKALALNPREARIYSTLAFIYNAQKNPAKAEESFLRAIALFPHQPLPYLALADIYIQEKKYSQAVTLLKNFPEGRYNPLIKKTLRLKLTELYFVTGRLALGYGLLEELFLENPPPDIFLVLAKDFQEQFQADTLAMNLLAQGIKVYPRSKELYLYLGVLLANTDHLEEAIRCWEKGSALDPADARFSENIKKAKQLQK